LRRFGPALEERDFRLWWLALPAGHLVGTVPAMVSGGVITILLAVSWRRIFPALADVDRLEHLRARDPARAAIEVAA
jgi:hypothetical protein